MQNVQWQSHEWHAVQKNLRSARFETGAKPALQWQSGRYASLGQQQAWLGVLVPSGLGSGQIWSVVAGSNIEPMCKQWGHVPGVQVKETGRSTGSEHLWLGHQQTGYGCRHSQSGWSYAGEYT